MKPLICLLMALCGPALCQRSIDPVTTTAPTNSCRFAASGSQWGGVFADSFDINGDGVPDNLAFFLHYQTGSFSGTTDPARSVYNLIAGTVQIGGPGLWGTQKSVYQCDLMPANPLLRRAAMTLRIWRDANGNGKFDTGEPSLLNWFLLLTSNVIRYVADPDLDMDGEITFLDLGRFISAEGARRGEEGFLPAADFDGNGLLDGADLGYLVGRME